MGTKWQKYLKKPDDSDLQCLQRQGIHYQYWWVGGFFKGCGLTKNDVALDLTYLDILCPDQQFFSNVMLFSCLPGLNQYLAGTKHSTPVSLQLSTVRSALV